ncbi:unnamed protein product [Aureobasidium uvarum]|uniref:Uncharacterized protein n=1 Tax=Aureobasidium uvarum TaxID=2773716 RepID=A0A9N8PUR5_9PEZI|nr:unnamed protein product [Aureobasidium uvarum]
MDYIYEKIAGKGPARKYNLEKCRKELEKSCSDYQKRGNCFPPPPRTTPCTSSAPTQQQPSPKQKKVRFQTYQSLNETAHIPHKVKRCPFQYNEKELRERAQQLKADSKHASKLRLHQHPVSTADPLDGYTGHDFSNDCSKDNSSTEDFAPRRHPTLHRQNLTQDEFIAIRDTAARIASHCAVRDKQPYPDSPPQEALHRIRSAVWSERAKDDGQNSTAPPPPGEAQDDNGISVTEDGCIIQRGFDISSMTSSPGGAVHIRCDSGCEVRCKTPNHVSPEQETRKEPLKSSVRNGRGARVPVCFRKQEISHQRKVSHLSALFSAHGFSNGQKEDQKPALENTHQAHMPQQRHRMPVPARPLVFSGSGSSGAVVSDSEDDSEEEQERSEAKKVDSATGSPTCADGAKDTAGHGSVATLVVSYKPAETVKTSNRLPQPSAPPSPPLSKLPVPSFPRVKQGQHLHAGTALPQRLSKHHDLASRSDEQAAQELPPSQQRNPQPRFLRSQQTAKVLLAHQQQRRARQAPLPHPQSPCQTLGLYLPTPPKSFSESGNYVSALLDKIERNGGRRPENFSWDHVAPMHGFSSCRAFYVLD